MTEPLKPAPRRIGRTSSSAELIVATALFVALFANVPYFKAAFGAFGQSAGGVAFSISLLVHITCLFVLVLSAFCHRALVKPVLIAFLLISSVIAYFMNTYGTIIDHHMITNMLETNTAEARDLFGPQLLMFVLILGVVPSWLVWRTTLVHPHWKAETLARLKLTGVSAAALAITFFAFSGHYTSMFREHGEVAKRANPTYALLSAVKVATHSWTSQARDHIAIGQDAKTQTSDGHRELVIMVVGETARADHWQLNGYPRETTPRLKDAQVTNFPDFWSCDTSTARSVPCMFSNLGHAKFDEATARSTDNALDILKRAGVSILWRDNNSSSKHVADRVAYQDFQIPQNNPVCDPECRDEGMLHGLQDYIDAQKGDILIVLHQMGNHGPAYYKRYPKSFEKFTPVCETNDLGSCTADQINNTYDNALLYTDYFLSKVIDFLKSNDQNFETAMLYVSDHGESLGEYGLYLHGTPYMIAPEAQRHVPAVMWFGEQIKHDLLLEKIAARSKQRWSHDNIFSTLLGLFEIQSETYDAKMDLLEHREMRTGALPNEKELFPFAGVVAGLPVGPGPSVLPQ